MVLFFKIQCLKVVFFFKLVFFFLIMKKIQVEILKIQEKIIKIQEEIRLKSGIDFFWKNDVN